MAGSTTERTVTDYTQVLAGTPAYMSPEVVRGADPAPSFDLWALAMVIYESFGLYNPMINRTVGETLKAVAAAHVPDIRERVPLCPASLAEFLAAALSSDFARNPGAPKTSKSAWNSSEARSDDRQDRLPEQLQSELNLPRRRVCSIVGPERR